MRKRLRTHGQELVKPVIAIPSFRVVADYEDRQQEVETRRKVEMQQHLVPSTHEVFLLNLGIFSCFAQNLSFPLYGLHQSASNISSVFLHRIVVHDDRCRTY